MMNMKSVRSCMHHCHNGHRILHICEIYRDVTTGTACDAMCMQMTAPIASMNLAEVNRQLQAEMVVIEARSKASAQFRLSSATNASASTSTSQADASDAKKFRSLVASYPGATAKEFCFHDITNA